MASKIGSLYYEIFADTKKLDAGLKQSKSGLSKMGDGFQKLTGFSLSAAGAIGLASVALKKMYDYSKVAIAAASDLAETESKVGVVFGDQADEMLKWGNTAAEAMGMSANEALAAAGTYGNLFRAMGIGVDVSADMSQSLVELAADLASFNNMDPTMVLDKLRAGLSGEVEPLRSLGVNLNQALIQEKALELGIWDGVDALSAAQKAQASYALILEQTTLAQGDFDRTSEGLANQQRILKASTADLAATIGLELLPVELAIVRAQNDMVLSLNDLIIRERDAGNAMTDLGYTFLFSGLYIKEWKLTTYAAMESTIQHNKHIKITGDRLNEIYGAGKNAETGLDGATNAFANLTDEIIPLNAYMSELTTQLIFQQAAAGLDENAQLALAEAMGLISPNTKMAMEAIMGFKGDLAETGEIDTYINRVDTLNDAMAKITNKNVSINIGINYGGEMGGIGGAEIASGVDLNGNGVIGAATGLSMRVPPGYPNDSFLIGVTSGEEVNVGKSKSESSQSAVFDYNRMGEAFVEALVRSGYMR